MSVIATLKVPADQFALQDTLASVPDAEFHMVRLVAYGGDDVLPFMWASSDDHEELYDALEEDESTGDVDVLTEFDDESLLRIDWDAHVRVLIYIISEADATVLDAVARDESWYLQIFFPEHDAVSTTYDVCETYGVDVSLERICQLSETCRRGDLGLTEEQYEAIMRAYEAGYYDVPRKVNQEELAQSFDVSHQALSERLRRGHGTIIANTLFHKLQQPDRDVTPRMRRVIDG